jgi:hypothetical protein
MKLFTWMMAGSLVIVFFVFVSIKFARLPGEVAETQRFNDSIRSVINYSFSGIVTGYDEKILERGTHISLVTLDLKTSDSLEYHDTNDSSNISFFRVKSGKVRVLFSIQYDLERTRGASNHRSIRVGDSLAFDGLRDKFYLFYPGDSASWSPMWLSTNPDHRRWVLKNLDGNVY